MWVFKAREIRFTTDFNSPRGFSSVSTLPVRQKKVIILGIDGMRPDAMLASGGLSPEARTVALAFSGDTVTDRGEIPVTGCGRGRSHLVDVVPTIASLFGLPRSRSWAGVSRLQDTRNT
jgi:hypothetical protein